MPTEAPPDGFSWRLLTDLARLETGHTPSRRVPEYWEGGTLPWIGVRDATGNHGRTIYATNEYITELGEQSSSTRLLPARTVCLSRTASVGYVVVMGVPMCTSQDFVNWVCGPDLDHLYLKYILLAEKAAFLRFASGTTHQTVYFPEVKAFHVMVPSVAEQRAIAGVLGALEDKIESNRRIATTAQDLADTIFSSSAEVSRPLGEVAEVMMGSSPPGSTYNEVGRGLPFYQGVADFDFRFPRLRVYCDGPVRTAEAGDALVSVRAPVGRLNRAQAKCCIGRGLAAVRSGTPRSLFYALRAAGDVWAPYNAEGTVFGAIKAADMQAVQVPWPSDKDLSSCERDLTAIDDRLSVALREISALTALRDVLLPELLSGRLRVRDAEQVLDEAL